MQNESSLRAAGGLTARQRSLLSGSAVVALVAAGLFSPMSLRIAAANNECGVAAPVPAGTPQVVVCGNIVAANTGVTYQDADIQDGSPFNISFFNTQVLSGGVLLQTTTASNPFIITIDDIDGAGGAAPPSITNAAGADAGLEASTGGTNSGITLNLNAGSVTGTGGGREGIRLTTLGTGSAINLTTLAGTTVTSGSEDGIRLDADGGSSITAVVNGSTTGGSGFGDVGLIGDVDGGTGFVNLTIGATGSATGGVAGVAADARGGGAATVRVLGTATGNGLAAGVGIGTGASAVTSNGGTASVLVGPAGTSTGTLFGVRASAEDAGNADVFIGSAAPGSLGIVSQTAATAGAVPILPAGALATSEDGNATITAHQGSTVNQIGSTSTVFGFLPEVKGVGMLALSTGTGNATVTADGTVNATGIGALSFTNSGEANTNVGGQINVGGGTGVSPLDFLGAGAFDLTVGAMALSASGQTNVNIDGGNIGSVVLGTTPDIGGLSLVLGGIEDANIDVGDGTAQASTILANDVGLIAVNLGSGDANVNLEQDPEGDGNLVWSGGIGVVAAAIGGGSANVVTGNSEIRSLETGIIAAGVLVNVTASTVTSQNGSGILALGGTAVVNVHGPVQGAGGLLTSTVAGLTSGAFTLNVDEEGQLNNNIGNSGSAVGVVSGDTIDVINDGTINGNMTLISANGNFVQNNSNNSWNWAGFNTFITGGDNVFENNGTATAGPGSLNTFVSGGDSFINNNATGTFNIAGFNTFLFITGGDSAVNNAGTVNATGLTLFLGLDDYNNSGLTNSIDGDPDDFLITTGNFNGLAGSTLSFDAELTPGGNADLLIIGENLTGVTTISVNDLDGGPGQFTGNDNAILFALVDDNTDPTNFTTNGGIDKGLFRYDAYLREDQVNIFGIDFSQWVLASTLDAEAFEFPVITYGAQNLWYASTGVWLDRTVDLRAALAAGGSGGGGADAALPIVEPVAGNVTPAVWGRVFGGTLERDISNISEAPDGLQGPAFTFEDQFNQDYYGVMAGVDFGKETGMNQAWMFGIMGGYTGSNLDFDGTGTEVEYQQGSIGAYITYINGGFFADVAVKGDFGSIDYSTQFGGTADADYVSIGVIGDVGYRHNMSSGWFIEPKATLAYVNTDIDDINVLGTGISFEDGDSVRGRLGARIGTQMQKGSSLIEPYLEANVWNEFEGNYNATLASGGFGIPVMYDAEGVFGEVTAGADIINVGNGWNAFGRASVQFGDDGLFGVSGNAGFRKAF